MALERAVVGFSTRATAEGVSTTINTKERLRDKTSRRPSSLTNLDKNPLQGITRQAKLKAIRTTTEAKEKTNHWMKKVGLGQCWNTTRGLIGTLDCLCVNV